MYDNVNISNFSQIISKLSIFLFIIAANYVGDIYSCGLRHIMKEFLIIKHIIGFFIMLFFIGLIQESLDVKTRILQSLILYIWFIFIMRAPVIITLIVILIISIIYIIDLYINDIKKKLKDNKELGEKNNKLILKYTNISNILFILSFVLSVIGTSTYIYILKSNLGKKFDIKQFLLGSRDQECFSKIIYKEFKKNPIFYDINYHIKNYKYLKN